MKLSGEVADEVASGDVNEGRDLKFKLPGETPPPMQAKAAAEKFPSRARAFAQPGFSANKADFADGSPELSESRPSAASPFERRAEAIPNTTLAMAQQAVDRSILGSLNLTVTEPNLRRRVRGRRVRGRRRRVRGRCSR